MNFETRAFENLIKLFKNPFQNLVYKFVILKISSIFLLKE